MIPMGYIKRKLREQEFIELTRELLDSPGQRTPQGPHMGEDNVPLLGGEGGQRGGVSGSESGVVKALAAGVRGFVFRVIQVQVVEQGPPHGSAYVHPERPGHPIGAEGHKQRVIQGGNRAVVLARGPLGLAELCSFKFVVKGTGQTR